MYEELLSLMRSAKGTYGVPVCNEYYLTFLWEVSVFHRLAQVGKP